MKKLLIIVSLLTVIFLTACNDKNSDKISVYTTIYPLQYFTERIGGTYVDVHSIFPPGTDEHTFKPTKEEINALANSDLFFYVGFGLEDFVENAKITLSGEHVKMVATAEYITEEMLGEGYTHSHEDEDEHQHDHGDIDPHVWTSPVLADALAFSIKENLIEIAPDNKIIFEKNFEELRDDFLRLDRNFIEMASNALTKTIFVSNDTLGYIAKTYRLEQIAIAGLHSQSEQSEQQLASIVETAKKHGVKYVLFEQNVSPKLIDFVRKEIGAESLMLHNLSVLTLEDVKNGENYFSLMERNIKTLEKALND